MAADTLTQKLQKLPDRPGVYLMKDDAGKVIYVGKALSLRNRVRSYFQKGAQHGPKVRSLVEHVHDLETIVTDNEVEALILESNLIKEKSPWYNVRLKDDKSYPYLKITDEEYPRVIVVRRPRGGGEVFGPYTNAHAVRETLKFLRKLFPVRTCSLDLSGELNYRPCLLYHIGRCGAPCAGLQDKASYDETLDEVRLFLQGRHDRLIPEMRKKMQAAAERLEFERAARLRDHIQALEKVVEKQKIVSKQGEDQDVVGLSREGTVACAQVFFVRKGKLVGRDHFFLEAGEAEDGETLAAFLEQYYTDGTFVPVTVLLPSEPEGAALIETWLSERRGRKVRLHVPQRGAKRRLVEMACDNARLLLEERGAAEEQRVAANVRGMQQLQEELGLPEPPVRIECYDISNIHGNEAVGSMVVLSHGEPDPSEYRRFKIRLKGGPDDFAMMREVVHRRFARGLKEREELAAADDDEAGKARFARFPDLVVIDGGKGQLGAARDAMRDLDLESIPTVGLAKREEEIFMEDDPDPLRLASDAPALHLLQRVRDEAHRFAITYHRKLRDKSARRSALDGIEGVGPKRKRELIRHFGSVKSLRQASLDELKAVPGLPEAVAGRIYEQLARS